MEKVKQCILCEHSQLDQLGEHEYQYPGDAVKENLLSKKYVRLWILFNHILKRKGKVKFEVAKCKNCGFIFSNPRFNRAEMATKYRLIDELGSVKLRIASYNKKYEDVRAQRIYELVNRTTLKFSDKQPRKHIVDFGGQSGMNLKYFDQNGYNCSVLDYEKWDLPGKIQYAGQELKDLKEKAEIILCNHTLEHIVDPIPFVKELAGKLQDEGLLYVEVPLGAFYREYKKVMKIEPMTHVNYFSEQSISYLFQKVGLKIVHLSTDYQHLQTAKQWCINAIVMKTNKPVETQERNPLSANTQLKKELFYNSVFVADHVIKRVENMLPF